VSALLALVLLLQAVPLPKPFPAAVEAALVKQESRGNPDAVSARGCVGLWQVDPESACTRLGTHRNRPASKARLAFCAAAAGPLMSVWKSPVLGTLGGRAVLRRYLARCGKRGKGLRCALQAYACGQAGLRGNCGWYADSVLARAR
jgi:hypothetical protein